MWYMVELVHPQHSRGYLTLPIYFLICPSDIIIYTGTVYQLVLFVVYGLLIDACFCSIQGYTYADSCIYLPEVMSPTIACYPVSSIYYDYMFTSYYSNASTAIYFIPLFESFRPINPCLLRGSPQWLPWIFWDGGCQLLVRQFIWFMWLHHWVSYQHNPLFPLKIGFSGGTVRTWTPSDTN